MSVMKYKDPKTGEIKKLFAPVIDSYSKTETYNKNEVYNKEEVNTLISEAISNAIITAIGGSY